MRSIGKKNIALVKKITKEEIVKRRTNISVLFSGIDYSGIEDNVIERLPVVLWDTWESADSEIHRIIQEEIAVAE
jgi:hypothetical protein